MKNVINKVKEMPAVIQAGKIAVLITAISIGFAISEFNHWLKVKSEEKPQVIQKMKSVKTLSKTSVAINERNELMVIDRSTGEFEIYSDSIGQTIFSLYAGRIYSQTQN